MLYRTDCPEEEVLALMRQGFRLVEICGWVGTPDDYAECRRVSVDEIRRAVEELLEKYDGATAVLDRDDAAAEVDFYRDPSIAVEIGAFAEPARGAVEATVEAAGVCTQRVE